jgi:hypothetical protein
MVVNRQFVIALLAAAVASLFLPGVTVKLLASVGALVVGFGMSVWFTGGLVEAGTGGLRFRVRSDPAGTPRFEAVRVRE